MNIKINKNIEVRNSIRLITEAFYTFREQPLQFILLGVIATILSFIPIVGSFFMPIFTARFALITNTIEFRQTFKFTNLFKEMFINKQILKLAIINFCVSTVFYIINYINEQYFFKSNQQIMDNVVIILILLPLLLFQLSMWLSPILCLFNKELAAVDAMVLSFKSSMFNMLLLFCYAILVLLFTLIAIIPIGLGLIIWLPILNISTYYVYKSMFTFNI